LLYLTFNFQEFSGNRNCNRAGSYFYVDGGAALKILVIRQIVIPHSTNHSDQTEMKRRLTFSDQLLKATSTNVHKFQS